MMLHCWGSSSLLGHESSGRGRSVGAAFPGQDISGVRLRKGRDSQHVVGVSVWQGAGMGGGTVSVTATVRNEVPHTSRSATAAFYAWLDIVVQRQGGGCGNDCGKDGGSNAILLAAMAGVGRHNE